MTAGPGILGFAACTSLGFTAATTLAAMEAGLNNFTATDIRDLSGELATAAQLPDVDATAPRAARIETLVRHALADLDAVLPSGRGPVPALLGVAADLSDAERRQIQRAFDSERVQVAERGWFPFGRSSTFAALREAVALIARGESDVVVVAGADSLCAPASVRALVQAGRMLGPGTEGTIPGEACSCVVLGAARPADGMHVEQVALHRAAIPFVAADRVWADGLTGALRTLREAGAARVEGVVAAHSGEGYFGRSFAHAYLRETELMPEPLDLRQIADAVGDVGAAAGIVGLAFATHLMQSPVAARRRTLVYSESDSGEVGAAIVAMAAGPESAAP